MDRCAGTHPELISVGDGHQAACLRATAPVTEPEGAR
jgi:hypothetical protein